MKKYKLSEDLKIGISEIDNQHEHLIELVNNLNELDTDKISRDDFLDIINELVSYAHIHFQTEEAYFKESDYSDAPVHIEKHQEFLKKVNDIFLSFNESESGEASKKLFSFMNSWILEHLMEEDKKFAKFYLKK